MYLSSQLPRGWSQKFSIFSIGTYGFFKNPKYLLLPQNKRISALRICFYFKYLHPILESPQMVKLKKPKQKHVYFGVWVRYKTKHDFPRNAMTHLN